MKISQITAREILDSRGNPTVEAQVKLEDGTQATASVPSGASTGKYEVIELRDNDENRYHGKGVMKAVSNINHIIHPQVLGSDVQDQVMLDQKMIEIDATENKGRLGANAILAVSMACCRAAATAQHLPLYRHLANLSQTPIDQIKLPRLMGNVLNGGKHAIDSVDMQEYMIIPHAQTFAEQVRWSSEVFHVLGQILHDRGLNISVGDEGGYAPTLKTNAEPLELLLLAIKQAGYEPGKQISLGIDPAASEFFTNNSYNLERENRQLSSQELVELYVDWINRYPIISIEDGHAEDDWQGFVNLTKEIGQYVQIVGDDLFVTNVQRLEKGITEKAGNAILIKLNQIGSVSETISAIKLAQANNFGTIISHRSGETTDTFIADLAVGTGAGQIKTGSFTRGERVAKYNRLMEIELELASR